MRDTRRTELARAALGDYAHGPDATREATRRALHRTDDAVAVILVEGISDQIAVETLAERRGRNLEGEGIVVVPIGGAQAVATYLRRFGPAGEHLTIAGLCDVDATETFCRGVRDCGIADTHTIEDLAAVGFHVCVRDLEEELIRAVGPEQVVEVITSQHELGPFRTFQKQPEWRGRALNAQLHRFFGSQARRASRYARLLVEAADPDRVPRPLDGVLTHVA